jgi:hypothetical protein
MEHKIFSIEVNKFLFLGNMVFGIFSIIFISLFQFCHSSIIIPIILNIIQLLFLLAQFIYPKLKN